MRLIKECVIRVLEALVILAFIYVMMESWDGSVAFNDERVAEHKATHEVVYFEGRNEK